MDHVSIDVFDYSGRKQCDLYDSFTQAEGQAYEIVYTQEINGWQEQNFNLPFVIDGRHNFRWDYIKSEYLVRLYYDHMVEWFVIQKPKASKNTKLISNTVSCPHISSLQKTKNLYLTFDDETGIGTVDELINRALSNTGWELGECDTLYERDGVTEKIRSLKSDGKKGAYQLITDICNLFKAYPIFYGAGKRVDIHALNNKGPISEMCIGKNINALSVEYSTENIITRLYVEGEYGDLGYVGIDDAEANETGLSYLMNFDYYKSIGVFTLEHQEAYDTYLADMTSVVQSIKTKTQDILDAEDRLNTLWGQINYVVYEVDNGTITKTITGGTVTDEQKNISEGDKLYVWGDYTTYVNQPGYYNVSTGEQDYIESSEHATWTAHTKLLSVAGVESISGRVYMDSYGYALAAFDANMNLLPDLSIVGTDGSNTEFSNWTIPNGVEYICLCGWVDSLTAEAISVTAKTPGEYRIVEAGSGGSVEWGSNDALAVKFITLPSGLIGSKQVAIETKEKLVVSLTKDKNNEVDPVKQQSIQDQIDAYNAAIQELYSGYSALTLASGGFYVLNGETIDITSVVSRSTYKNILTPCVKGTEFQITGKGGGPQARLWAFVDASQSDIAAIPLDVAPSVETKNNYTLTAPENTTHLLCNFNTSYPAILKQHIFNGDGLYEEMGEAVQLVITLDGLRDDLENLQSDQLGIESTFYDAMGDMLRDGYWSNNNYAPGQEDWLYEDALEVMDQMAKPTVKYTFTQVGLSEVMGYTEKLPEINDKVKIWDIELKLNDIVYVSKRTQYLDKSQQDKVEVSNDDPTLSGQSFESVMSRISQLADLIDQKNTLYERAGAITSSGTIYAQRLNGAIDVLKNKLSSSISNWYTDDSGALVFESVNGDSAMMLTGDGFMIANGKTRDGDWNWRTFGSGAGFTADAIITGYLSADRIEAGTITSSKLSSSVGEDLNLSANTSVTNVTSTHITLAEDHLDIASGGKVNIESGADIKVKSGGDIDVESGGNINVNSGGNLNVKSNGDLNVESGGKLSVQSSGEVEIASRGTLDVKSGATVNIAASKNLLPDSENERQSNGRRLVLPVADILTPYIGRTISVSFEIKGTVASDVKLTAYQSSGVSIGESHTFTIPTTDFERFSFSTTVTDYTVQPDMTTGAISFYNLTGAYDYSVRKIMIELGDTATSWVPASGMTMNESGITMSSGKLNFTADSEINFESGGTFNVFANDDESSIKFGGTTDDPNFSLGSGGTVKATKIVTQDLELTGSNTVMMAMPGTLSNNIIVSETQPNGHGIIWIKPGGTTSTVDYNLNDCYESMNGQNVTKTITGFAIQGNALAGNYCSYGIKFRIYNYQGSCMLNRVTVTLQNGDGTGSTVTVFDEDYYSQGRSQYIGVGDYITVNTLTNPADSYGGNPLENLTSASSLKMTITLQKSASTSARFEGVDTFIVRCVNQSTAQVQLCDVKYIP